MPATSEAVTVAGHEGHSLDKTSTYVTAPPKNDRKTEFALRSADATHRELATSCKDAPPGD